MRKQSKVAKMLAKFICYAIQAQWDKSDGRISSYDQEAAKLFQKLRSIPKEELIAAEKEL